MKMLISTLKSISGLFIEDGSLTFAILIWVGLIALGLHFDRARSGAGAILAIGLMAILLENVFRSAGRTLKAGKSYHDSIKNGGADGATFGT